MHPLAIVCPSHRRSVRCPRLLSRLRPWAFLALLLSLCGLVRAGNAQTTDLTVDVLVNSTNSTYYNVSPTAPGEYQRYPERYLEHLQIPYRVIDVSQVGPPDLTTVQLIVAAHRGLNLSSQWQAAIASAVAGGVGFVDLDNDLSIGTQAHMQSIFGATGSTAGSDANEIIVPAAVQPGGSAPHYVAGMQLHFLSDPAGDLIYKFHGDGISSYPTLTPTVLTGAHGTAVANFYSTGHGVTNPMILTTTYGKGSAVYFSSYDYLRADRFGFNLGVDDLFWRSLVWAARKPFVIRGYPRLFAVQMDDNAATDNLFATRIQHFWDTSLTGNALPDGTGGPWLIDVYHDATTIGDFGSANRDLFVSEIQAGHVKASPHRNTDITGGDLYWNAEVGPLTDAQWFSELNQTIQLNKGNGGNDSIPISRSMIPEFWDLSNNTGYDMWNTLGYRYILEIQQPGAAYYSSTYKTNAQRLPYRPFRVYEQPPIFNDQDETEPFFYADYYTVNSRSGLPPKTFFAFSSQILQDQFRFPAPDAKFPDYQGAGTFPVANSVENFQVNAWRFWSGLAPVVIFCHDENSYANTPDSERVQFVQQLSNWLNANGVVHTFVEKEGDYLLARRQSTLASGQATPTQISLTFTGQATDFDGNQIPTKALVFYGNNEGTWVDVPGFGPGGYTLSFANATPPAVALSQSAVRFATVPGTNPASQSVTIANGGGGTLNWYASTTANWLTLSPASGTGGGSLQLSVSSSSLAAGTYTTQVAVSATGATNSPQYIQVTLVVGATAFATSPTQLSFAAYQGQGSPAAQSVAISNSGGGVLNWSASSNASWLTVSPTTGGAPSTLTAAVSSAGLAPGTYSGAIRLTSSTASNSPTTIPVTLTVTGVLLGDNFANGTLDGWAYSPLGHGTNWSVSNSAVYYNGGGHTQIYAGNSGWSDYTVQASIQLASLANYPGGIRGRVNPSTGASYAVWLYPASGVLRLYRTQQWNIDAGFTQLGPDLPVTFDATSYHTVALRMQGSTLEVLYDQRLLLTTTDTVLTAGLIALDVSNQPVAFTNVAVIGNASTNSALAPSTSTLSFAASTGGTAPPAQTFTLNTSGSTSAVAWSAAASVPWLTVTPGNGSTPATISVAVQPGSLAAGNYTGVIALSSLGVSNSPANVTVQLAVTAPMPNLSLAPSALSCAGGVNGPSSVPQTLAITSSGGSSSSWSVSSDAAWLSTSSTSGGTPAAINVACSTAGLAGGTYTGHLTVTAPGMAGSPAMVPVTFSVTPLFAADQFAAGTLDGWTASPLGHGADWSVGNGAAQYDGAAGGAQLYAGNFGWGDLTFTSTVQLATLDNWPGGIRGRVQPNGGGYGVWLYPGSSQIVLYRINDWKIDDGYTMLGSVGVAFDTNPHRLALQMMGSALTVLWDGNAVLTVNDSTYATGAIAFDVSNQVIRYSHVLVQGPVGHASSLVAPSAMAFSGPAGGASPAAQTLTVTSSDGGAMAFSAKTAATWLTLSAPGGTAEGATGTITVTANTSGLAAGTYQATIYLTALGDASSPESVAVTLTVQ